MQEMKQLIENLNKASDAYYNTGDPIMSDAEFDSMLEELRKLEEETGIVYSNSPTHKVGAKLLDGIEEVTHSHPMLSLAKCHTSQEIIDWAKGEDVVTMVKLDGLTVSIRYENGILVSAESRGNGVTGSNVTEHIKQFTNVPLTITKSGVYVIDGEAIIFLNDFESINADGELKNARNAASGALNRLDTEEVKKRKLSFVAWDVIEGSDEETLLGKLCEAKTLGFRVVPTWYNSGLSIDELNETVLATAKEMNMLADGVVWKINNCKDYYSRGRNEHDFKGGIAWKRSMEEHLTVLRDVIWQTSKTGQINPVAVFDPVDLDGAITTRATLHNVSRIKQLELGIGDTIAVIRSNEVIPSVTRNLTKGGNLPIRVTCPCCGSPTKIVKENDSEFLFCTGLKCAGKTAKILSHFCGKQGLDIDGLSDATLEFLVNEMQVSSAIDLFTLHKKSDVWKSYPGFNEKSVNNILDAIANAVNTTLERFICALSIPKIGKVASKLISNSCSGNYAEWISLMDNSPCDLEQIDGLGHVAVQSMINWWKDNRDDVISLGSIMQFTSTNTGENECMLREKTFVITGKLEKFNNRDELVRLIESLGGKVSGCVSAKTSFLINNDLDSASSKNKKAKDLNVPIISEQLFLDMINKTEV